MFCLNIFSHDFSRNLFKKYANNTYDQGRNQGGAKGTEAPLSPLNQVKVEKKNKKFYFLANFVHTSRSKCYCNTIITSQLSNFIEF